MGLVKIIKNQLVIVFDFLDWVLILKAEQIDHNLAEVG